MSLSSSVFRDGKRKNFIIAAAAVFLLGLIALGAAAKNGWLDAKSNYASSASSRTGAVTLAPVNPAAPAAAVMTSPTPQLSKEYVYAGSRLLAVEDAGTQQHPPADLAVWRPSSGTWYVLPSSGASYIGQQWGTSGDITIPADFDGDGKIDFCVYRASTSGTSAWYVLRSSDGQLQSSSFGATADVPAVADYDADGRADVAVYKPSDGTWHWLKSSDGAYQSIQYGGASLDAPVPADYDGDGKADVAVWRGSDAMFYILQSNNSTRAQSLGANGDTPVAGDFDGDGKSDCALWRSNNDWLIYKSSTSTTETVSWGSHSTDKDVAGDYDGDGKTDIAVWRTSGTSAGMWQIRKSSNLQTRTDYWGTTGDIPVPAPYRR